MKTLFSTCKAVTRPIMEYDYTMWSLTASTSNITKLHTIQHYYTSLGIATGSIFDTNIRHMNDEAYILPSCTHLKLHASQIRQKPMTLHTFLLAHMCTHS